MKVRAALVQHVNRIHGRLGTLWAGRFRCHQYIEMNPVRAGIVDEPSAYPWSSYRFNAIGEPDSMLKMHPSVEALGRSPEERRAAYRQLFLDELQPGFIAQIRDMTNGGHAFGTESFKSAVARTLGREVVPQRRGPKPKGRREN